MTDEEQSREGPTTVLVVHDVLLDRVREALVRRRALLNGQGLLEPMSARRWQICKEMERKIVLMAEARIKQQLLEQRLVREQRARDLQQEQYNRHLEASRAAELALLEKRRKAHRGYPLPHPQLGRPRLKMLTCLYPQCGRVFASDFDLDNHLRAERQADHVPRFHRSHHDFVTSNDLTPEWIRREKLLKCPSLVCAQRGHTFATPDDLIYHFEELGIESFWKPGWCPRKEAGAEEKKEEDAKKKKKEEQLDTAAASSEAKQDDHDKSTVAAAAALEDLRIKDNDDGRPPPLIPIHVKEHFNILREDNGDFPECMCCFDADPDIIALPCSHQVLCDPCFFKLASSKCPVCRSHIDAVIPSVF
jgi:hypothetical protein